MRTSAITRPFISSLISANPTATQFLVGDAGMICKNFVNSEYTSKLAIFNGLTANTPVTSKVKVGSTMHTLTVERRYSSTLGFNLVLIVKTS